MLITILTPALALLLTTTTAHPANYNLTARNTLTAAGLQSIAPTSNTCSGATYPKECKTASQALGPILDSFNTYKISDPATQAAVLSTIAFESGDFKYAHHYFPSPNPGQGTRNMQSSKFNTMYAQSIPELKPQLAKAQGADAVLNLLVSYSDYDFGSAAWFLSSQCTDGVKSGLKTPGAGAFGKYITDCLGTTLTDGRTQYYNRALAALGVKGS